MSPQSRSVSHIPVLAGANQTSFKHLADSHQNADARESSQSTRGLQGATTTTTGESSPNTATNAPHAAMRASFAKASAVTRTPVNTTLKLAPGTSELGFTVRSGSVQSGSRGQHIISQVREGTAAAAAGLMEGDHIISVAGERVASLWTQEVCRKIQDLALTGVAVPLTVSRAVESGADARSGGASASSGEPRRSVSSRTSRDDLLHAASLGVGSPPRDRLGSTASSLDAAAYRRQSMRDRVLRKPKRDQGFLQGMQVPVSYISTADPGLGTMGAVVHTAPLMHWRPAVGGVAAGMSPERSRGKLRAVILTEQCALVAKWKGNLFNLKGVIKLG